MKYLLTACFSLLLFMPVFSQDYDFSGLQGLSSKSGEIQFELSGYEIFVTSVKGMINDKTINSLKKKYDLSNILAQYSEPSLHIENKIIEAESVIADNSNVKISRVCYILYNSDKESVVILLQTLNQRDIVLEQNFVSAYLNNQLTAYISDDWSTNIIPFAGRDIDFSETCTWIGPHNIQYGKGQISWSEFPSFESANLDINTRIESNKVKGLRVLSAEDVDVVFEGIPSLAHHVIYEKRQGGDLLNVYYIAQEVRGRYISCVMSNNKYGLSPLLREVISVPELTVNETFDESDIFVKEDDHRDDVTFEIRGGTWVPLGSIKKVFDYAPSFGLFMGLPIKKTMGIDLGLQVAFPVNRKTFDYYDKDYIYDAKTDLLADISLRFRYEQEAAKNVYWTTYAGTGFSGIQTNLEKSYDEDGNADRWYSISSFSLFGGVKLRYKKVGCFLEYRYSPYSIANKVRKSFGNSIINTGICVTFK